MTLRKIVPAEVDFADPHAPRAPQFDDVYHARQGAFAQARHVFIAGNGLPARWAGRAAFTVLETGFGLGNNFLATWAAWRADPARPRRLRFISIEKHPLRATDLRRALAASAAPELAAALCDAWPPLTPDHHLLTFDDDAVELMLVFADAADALRGLVAAVDAIYLDGFAPDRNPRMWDAPVFKALARLAAPGATAATWSAARAVREGLAQAGFAVRRSPGSGGKRDITLADFASRTRPRPPAARTGSSDVARVAIVGGGLAGAACARALAQAGLEVVVLDAATEPATGASGNAAGLFHGVFHPDDGAHARALRAAALLAARSHGEAIAQGVPGRREGLLRLVPEQADAGPLADALAASGLPPDFVQAWTPAQVQASGGAPAPAWFYPGGGWIAPAALVRAWLQEPGITWRGGAAVDRLERVDAEQAGQAAAPAAEAASAPVDGAHPSPRARWRLLDARGAVLAEVEAVVFANADAASALWARTAGSVESAGPAWMPLLTPVRGQVSIVAADTPGLRAPHLPIAGAGYALALPGGALLCGATSSANDPAPEPRIADHAHNLRQLARLTGWGPPSAVEAEAVAAALLAQGRLQGRVGWRATSPDRLPWIGAVPAAPAQGATTPDQPRHWPRVPGLFVASGFGSRGLTWAPLAGRLIAAWVTGAPHPLPADLVDALDPARFATRAVRASRRPGAVKRPDGAR
jgi:tRNA 5-methylaminomethyl-2-thiouridine biosynthesis bifunctional protein